MCQIRYAGRTPLWYVQCSSVQLLVYIWVRVHVVVWFPILSAHWCHESFRKMILITFQYIRKSHTYIRSLALPLTWVVILIQKLIYSVFCRVILRMKTLMKSTWHKSWAHIRQYIWILATISLLLTPYCSTGTQ